MFKSKTNKGLKVTKTHVLQKLKGELLEWNIKDCVLKRIPALCFVLTFTHYSETKQNKKPPQPRDQTTLCAASFAQPVKGPPWGGGLCGGSPFPRRCGGLGDGGRQVKSEGWRVNCYFGSKNFVIIGTDVCSFKIII